MNHPVAQLVALTCHGNAHLRGARAAVPFFPGNSTCAFCDRIDFAAAEGWLARTERTIAATPDDWFVHLERTGANALRVLREPQNHPLAPDRMTAGFAGGGGRWMLAAANGAGFAYWSANWSVWNRDAPERRIWRVTYRLVRTSTRPLPPDPPPADATRTLSEALVQIRDFAHDHHCDPFTARFDDAIAALSGSGARHGYHRDLAGESQLSEASLALLDAAQSASVFGGMGSWNDLGFDDADAGEYERVSAALFDALNVAICAAANESAHG
jgi:hypothetical protein